LKLIYTCETSENDYALTYVGYIFNDHSYNFTLWSSCDDVLAIKGYDTGNAEVYLYDPAALTKGFAFPYDVIFKGVKIVSSGRSSNGNKFYVRCQVIQGSETSASGIVNKLDEYTEYVYDKLEHEHLVFLKKRMRGRRFFISIVFDKELTPYYIEQIQYIFEPRPGRR